MRFIKEFFHPKKKCERIGHKLKIVTKKIRRESSEFRVVVADFNAEFEVCTRCNFKSEPKNEVEVDWFNGCSMPTSMWDEIRSKGYVEV